MKSKTCFRNKPGGEIGKMTVPVTRTKIIVPQPRFDLLSRPRLLDMLKDVLDYPLTLISAPAGYGKTSLLIDFAHVAEHPVTWFKIDNLDQDITRFLYHLAASIDVAFPSCGSRMFSAICSNPSASTCSSLKEA